MARTSAELTPAEILVVQSLDPLGTAGQLIRVNAWATELEYFTQTAWTGDVVWPASATDGNFALFDTTTGKLLKNGNQGLNSLQSYEGNGLRNGCTITINADTTKFDIASGVLFFVDNTTTPDVPVFTKLAYAGAAANVVTNIASANSTYISLTAAWAIVQRTSPLTPSQRRTEVELGTIIHSNRVVINAINNWPEIILDIPNQFYDLVNALKGFNVSGNVMSPNGANLQVNKSAGSIFKRGSNFSTDILNPHTKTTGALVAPTNIRYRTQNGTESLDTNSIDPNNYDVGGTVTTIPGTTNWTIQRISLFPSNLIRIQYGQAYYTSLTNAQQAIETETFVTEQNIAENGLLIGLLIVRDGATDLSLITRAQFRNVNRFGDLQGTAGATGTTTLQQAYNNSITPEIVTDATNGALSVKRGSAADTDNVFDVLNGAGTVMFSVNGDGAIELWNASDTTISRVSAGVVAVEGVAVPTVSSTNTLTNKRVTKRLVTTTQSATPTINTDNGDIFKITGLAQAITSFTTNLSGTPVEGDLMMIQITDNWTAMAITWGASFSGTTITPLPSTTVISTMLRVVLQWNGSTWVCIAVN